MENVEKLLDKDYVGLYYYPDQQIVELKWKLTDQVTDEQYRVLWNQGLREVVQRNCYRMLIDQREIGRVQMQSRAWLLVTWFPNARKQLGDSFNAAIMVTADIRQKTGMQFLVDGMKRASRFNLEFFTDRDQALDWLKNQ